MPKYYVESGWVRMVLDARNPEQAAVKAFSRCRERQAKIYAEAAAGIIRDAEAVEWELADEMQVSETGFRGTTARRSIRSRLPPSGWATTSAGVCARQMAGEAATFAHVGPVTGPVGAGGQGGAQHPADARPEDVGPGRRRWLRAVPWLSTCRIAAQTKAIVWPAGVLG